MSKRAEELAKRIDDILEQGSMGTNGLYEAAAFIDAELRKERERAAERAAKWAGVWLSENEHEELRAAILAEDED